MTGAKEERIVDLVVAVTWDGMVVGIVMEVEVVITEEETATVDEMIEIAMEVELAMVMEVEVAMIEETASRDGMDEIAIVAEAAAVTMVGILEISEMPEMIEDIQTTVDMEVEGIREMVAAMDMDETTATEVMEVGVTLDIVVWMIVWMIVAMTVLEVDGMGDMEEEEITIVMEVEIPSVVAAVVGTMTAVQTDGMTLQEMVHEAEVATSHHQDCLFNNSTCNEMAQTLFVLCYNYTSYFATS